MFIFSKLRRSYRTPEFPPKRLRNSSSKVLELRRQLLEKYIKIMVAAKPVPEALLQFLDVPQRSRFAPEAAFLAKSFQTVLQKL
jgi:hypothetical protein